MTKDQFITRVSEEIDSYVCPDCGGTSRIRLGFYGEWPASGILTYGIESICCEANRQRFHDFAVEVAQKEYERLVLSW